MNINLIEKIAARYIVTGETIRELAKYFNISKTVIHYYLCYKAKDVLPNHIYDLIQKRAESNINELRTYGKTIGEYNFNKDIELSDIDTYDNDGVIGLMKPFFKEEELDEFTDFKIKVKNILRNNGCSPKFIKNNLKDSCIEDALENDFSPQSLAFALMQ